MFLHVFAYDFIRFYSSCSEVMPAFPNLAPTTRHLVHMHLFGVRVVRALFGLVRASPLESFFHGFGNFALPYPQGVQFRTIQAPRMLIHGRNPSFQAKLWEIAAVSQV